ncbi:MAG: alpha/beta hydrolase [Gammaproteobacteria bacterium]
MSLRNGILGATALLVIGIATYVDYYIQERKVRLSPADPVALEALVSSSSVKVTETDWYVFEPVGQQPQTGMIFYPGGECDERGYAELLNAIAAEGYLVVLVPMPLQLAVLAPNKAEDVTEAFPAIENWAISGHSLGGAMAARYVYNHPGEMQGLLFWDAYPPETDDISNRDLAVRLIHRSDETSKPPDYYTQYFPLLPDHMDMRPIIGGSHINFGRFIPAERFRTAEPATIPIEDQHQQIVSHSVDFLGQL